MERFSAGNLLRAGAMARRSGAAVAVVVTVLAGFAVAAPSALAARNVNFVGRWVPKGGVGWTITRENRRTGVCAGRSALKGYGLVNCRVHGATYTFTITYGPSYKSYNKGTIKGNRVVGTFHDTNGTTESYTARRRL